MFNSKAAADLGANRQNAWIGARMNRFVLGNTWETICGILPPTPK